MRVISNGCSLYYEVIGPEDGAPVMLSNSLLSNRRMWDPQMPALSGHRVVRYDQRGHGDSDASDGAYTFELLAEDALHILDALAIDRVHFVGLSMGGMTGQALALYHPERIASLVLADTRGHTPEARKPLRAQRIETARTQGVEPMVEGCIEGWFSDDFSGGNPDLMNDVRAMIRSTKPLGLIGCTHALNAHNYTPRLGEIACPTLIIVGEDDQGTPVSESEAMRERIPNAQMIVIPNARHLSNMERPDLFNAALLEFLRANGG